MADTVNISADAAIFAGKVSTLLKLCGFDPSLVNLDLFRIISPVIFVKSYCIIYQKDVGRIRLDEIDDISSVDSTLVKLVIDDLFQKTNNDALKNINGNDIVEGKHYSIGVLVGILWNQLQLQAKEISSPLRKAYNNRNEQNNSTNTTKYRRYKQQMNSDDEDENSIKNDRNDYTPLRGILKNSQNNTPTAMQEISSPNDTQILNKNRPKSAKINTNDRYSPYKTPLIEDKNTSKPTRPNSAGPISQFPDISKRLYNSESHKLRTLTFNQVLNIAAKGENSEQQQDSRPKFNNILSNKPIKQPELHELMINPISQIFKHTPNNNNRSMPLPSVPVNSRTMKSIHEYNIKMKEEREGKPRPPPKSINLERYYKLLEPLDILITIEHCHSCKRHNSTLKHIEQDYVNYCNVCFSILVYYLHKRNICARVGVTRFPAEIYKKIQDSNMTSEVTNFNRVGAFEIQIASRVGNNVQYDILHSKLHARRWPKLKVSGHDGDTTYVIDKRISNLLDKHLERFTTYKANNNDDIIEMNTDGNIDCAYPIGHIEWNQLEISDETWKYPLNNNGTETQDLSSQICWIYDTRNLANPQKKKPKSIFNVPYPIGSIVSASNITNVKGTSVERHSVQSEVVDYIENQPDKVMIKLNYSNEVITVDLNSLSSVNSTLDNNQLSNDIPKELECCLLLKMNRFGINSIWKVIDSTDKQNNDEVILSYNSFYLQLRELVYELEKLSLQPGTVYVQHPITNENIDLQLAYSKSSIEWIESRFGNKEINTKLLELLSIKSTESIQSDGDNVASQENATTIEVVTVTNVTDTSVDNNTADTIAL